MGPDRWYIGIWRSWIVFIEIIGGKIVFLMGYNKTSTYLFELQSLSLRLRLKWKQGAAYLNEVTVV
jgi:hypothetical protein